MKFLLSADVDAVAPSLFIAFTAPQHRIHVSSCRRSGGRRERWRRRIDSAFVGWRHPALERGVCPHWLDDIISSCLAFTGCAELGIRSKL